MNQPKLTSAQIDDKVLTVLAPSVGTLCEIQAGTGLPERIVDRSLQRLRKARRATFNRKTWRWERVT